MICYLSKNYNSTNGGGNKAKTDIEQIMENLQYKNVGLKQSRHANPVLAFLLTLAGVLKSLFSLRKGDVLVLQYPFKKYYAFVCNIAHFRGCKVITLIHDLGSFRRKRLSIQDEITRLNHSDVIIAHNDLMKEWLEDRDCKAKVCALKLFDYLSETTPSVSDTSLKRPYRVLYAGALTSRQNDFLYKLEDTIFSYRLVLYGGGFDTNRVRTDRLIHKGFMPSDDLIRTAEGDFGLVWYGDSIDTVSGNVGEYLPYINPHKMSLYFRCGIPVVVWEDSASASFVREYNIGICVHSLKELDGVLSALTEEQYQTMKTNVKKISQKISKGYYFSTAIEEALTCFGEKKTEQMNG